MADRPRIRWLPFPSEREDYRPEPMTAVRSDGTTVDIRRTLGLPSVPAADPLGDDAPGWYPWPPP